MLLYLLLDEIFVISISVVNESTRFLNKANRFDTSLCEACFLWVNIFIDVILFLFVLVDGLRVILFQNLFKIFFCCPLVFELFADLVVISAATFPDRPISLSSDEFKQDTLW
jgi:hypothetical protein